MTKTILVINQKLFLNRWKVGPIPSVAPVKGGMSSVKTRGVRSSPGRGVDLSSAPQTLQISSATRFTVPHSLHLTFGIEFFRSQSGDADVFLRWQRESLCEASRNVRNLT